MRQFLMPDPRNYRYPSAVQHAGEGFFFGDAMTDERWAQIEGYPNYEVSSRGMVRSIPRIDSMGRIINGGILKLMRSTHKQPRPLVNLCNQEGQKTFAVSSLVAKSFLGPRPHGMGACHNNGDPFDNRVENLRYDTQAGNCADKIKHGTAQYGELIGTSKLKESDVIEIRERYSAGQFQSEIARNFNTCQTNISSIVHRLTWRYLP